MPPKNPHFDLKLKFQKMLELGIILALVLLILAFTYFPEIKVSKNIMIDEQHLITTMDIPMAVKLEPPQSPLPKLMI